MTAELERLAAAVVAPGGPDVVEVPAALEAGLTAALAARGWLAVRVDRAPVHDRATLLHALYQAGELPGWFGFNWDALLDCLADWSWRPAVGHALVFRDLALLEARAPEVARTFLEVVADARSERGAALKVVRLTGAERGGAAG